MNFVVIQRFLFLTKVRLRSSEFRNSLKTVQWFTICRSNMFIFQTMFLKICKIQQKTIKNVCHFHSSENFAKMFTVHCNYR